MTRRERLEAKAERRREWAEKRAAKGDAASARVHQIMDGIPFGQPILVGHHSERRARKDQDRMHAGTRAAVDNWNAAEHHAEKADGLERQLRTSIFSDDVDAVEQLEAKAARLEAKQQQMKTANATYRKEHRDTLKTMTPYGRSQAVPFPSYAITNNGAEIRRCRDRITQVRREQAAREAGRRIGGRVMLSKYPGTCPDCHGDIARGDAITWYRSTREAVHVNCPTTEG